MADAVNAGNLSSGFSSRLATAAPDSRLRAVLLLGHLASSTRRAPDRGEQIRRVKESATAALNAVDEILSAHHGQRIENEPNSLGYVTVETTPLGIQTLAESEQVRAILEDPAIRSAL